MPVIAVFLLPGIDLYGYLKDRAQNSFEEYQPVRLVVKIKSDSASMGAGKKSPVSAVKRLEEFSALNGISHVKAFKRNAGVSVASDEDFSRVYILTLPPGSNASEMAARYAELPEIEYAEPDYMAELYGVPQDALYPQQWGLNNTGQWHYKILRRPGPNNDKLIVTHGVIDADIDVAEVFDQPPDVTDVVTVAIVDSGVDRDHPDLAKSMWSNPREIANNGIDDDNNGYIDDVFGWDFSAGDDILDINEEDNDPTDEFGHGTHCAGIIAGVSNNIIGIAGITNNCKIMAVKIIPWPLITKIAAAIIYAADNGADVISMSFGFPFRSYLLEDALIYARSKGAVLVAAAGNTGIEEYNYPAASEYTIAVGSFSDSDFVSLFSTYGEHLSVCAPGECIVSLRADSTDMYADEEPGVHIFGELYYMASGTSMACPHVSGVAAYMRSVSTGLSPYRVQKIIEETAEDYVDPYGLGWDKSGWDMYSGYGKVSLWEALSNTPSSQAKIYLPRNYEIINGSVKIVGLVSSEQNTFSLEYGAGNAPTEWEVISTVSGPPPMDRWLGTWDTQGLSGKYTLKLKAGGENRDYITVFVANETVSQITFPEDGDTLINVSDIYASAYSPDFSYLILEYDKIGDNKGYIEIANVSVPVKNELINNWIVELLSEGKYKLRLTVFSTGGEISQHEIQVFIKSIFSGERAWKNDLASPSAIIANYGDIDDDGNNEILIGTKAKIKVFNPDGTPKTDGIPEFPQNSYLTPVVIGNLDSDGIDDVIAFGNNPPTLYGFPSSGNAFEYSLDWDPDMSNFTQIEHEFIKLFAKDMDNNGRDEIFLTYADNDASKAAVFNSEGEIILYFNGVSELLSADLDGDDTDELYAYSEIDNYVKKYDIYGNVLDSVDLSLDGKYLMCNGISAFDVDNDDLHELIVYGIHGGQGYHLYAFDNGFQLLPGWSRDMAIRDYLVPTVPVFADLDRDGTVEYMSTYFDLSVAYVHVWNNDGSPFIEYTPNGLFATIPFPGILNMLTVADVNGDDQLDIIACANDDLFFSHRVQRIYAWDLSGNLLPQFPIITAPENPIHIYTDFRFSPVFGDINKDGFIDLVMPTSDNALVFVNFPGAEFESKNAPVPFWRYNRSLDNIGAKPYDPATDVSDDAKLVPVTYHLGQNYPNPFNPLTFIKISLPQKARIKVEVYNILGRKVKVLADKSLPAGVHEISWDGTDDKNQPVASGIYFYNLQAGDFSASKKMVLLR